MDGGRSRRKRRYLQPPARHDRHRHQHRPRTHGALGHHRKPAPGVRRFRLEHSLLRAGGSLHRSSRSAGAGRPGDRPPGGDLRVQRPGRCARGESGIPGWNCLFRRGTCRGHGDRGLSPADARRSQRIQRSGRRRRRTASGHEGIRDSRRSGRFQGREPPLSPGSAKSVGSPSSTTTDTIPSKSPPS